MENIKLTLTNTQFEYNLKQNFFELCDVTNCVKQELIIPVFYFMKEASLKMNHNVLRRLYGTNLFCLYLFTNGFNHFKNIYLCK